MTKTKKPQSKLIPNALQKIHSELEAMPREGIQPPSIPVDRLIAEALALSVTAHPVKDDLMHVGVAESLLQQLPLRAHALAEAQAEYRAVRGLKRSEAEIGLEMRANELRSEMIADGRFALRTHRDAQLALDAIQEGEGLDDLVQDLKDLAAFAERYKTDLSKIGARPEFKVQRARKIASELESYLATRRGTEREEERALDVRNRAATYLTEAMAEIRAAGVYAFRNDPRTMVKFRSAYNRAKGLRAKKEPKEPQ